MAWRLISFDWALKRLLRSKANFRVLEGLLSVLLKEEVRIIEVLESESNKEDHLDKFNRVDMKVRNQKEEVILIELQYDNQPDFLHRILYSTSKAITEHLRESDEYRSVVKVISVNILFFNPGKGKDYVYHGTTNFRGIHENDILELDEAQRAMFLREHPREIYPEYYLLNVNGFNDVAKDPLDEWIYFLKHEEIKSGFKAPGLSEAQQILDIMKLSPEDRAAYERYIEDARQERSLLFGTYDRGRFAGLKEGIKKGIEKGIEKGIKKGISEVAERLLPIMEDERISEVTGLPVDAVREMRGKKRLNQY